MDYTGTGCLTLENALDFAHERMSSAEEAAVQGHVETCPACAQLVAKVLDGQVDALDDDEEDEDREDDENEGDEDDGEGEYTGDLDLPEDDD
jgi:hypothetical protein